MQKLSLKDQTFRVQLQIRSFQNCKFWLIFRKSCSFLIERKFEGEICLGVFLLSSQYPLNIYQIFAKSRDFIETLKILTIVLFSASRGLAYWRQDFHRELQYFRTK